MNRTPSDDSSSNDTCEDFEKTIQNDEPIQTFRDALATKRYDMVKMVEEKKKKRINVEKHFLKIIETNDMLIVSSLIPDPSLIIRVLDENSLSVIKNLDSHIVFYLSPKGVSSIMLKHILAYNKINIIEYYLSKGIDILPHASGLHDLKITNMNFFVFLYSRGLVVRTSYIHDIILSNNFSFVVWMFSNLDLDIITRSLKEFYVPKEININTEIVLFLYKKGYCVYKDIYTYAFINNILTQFEDIAPTINSEILVHYASQNIFNKDKIKSIKLNSLAEFNLLYYAIKYKRDDIYLSDCLMFGGTIPPDYIILGELDDKDCLYDYSRDKIIQDCSCFLEKYMDSISKLHNNNDILRIVLQDYKCSLDVALECHKRGMSYVIEHLYNTDKLVYDKLSKENLIYACRRSFDLILLKEEVRRIEKTALIELLIRHKLIDIKYMLKYCDNHDIINYGKLFSTKTKGFLSFVPRYGNLEIIKYHSKRGLFDMWNSSDLFDAFCNCPRAAEYILKSIRRNKHTLSKYIIKKDLDTKDPVMITKYYEWLTNLPTPIQIHKDELGPVVETDNLVLYKHITRTRYFPILKMHIYAAIHFKSYKILDYLGSIGQLILPFCCYPETNRPILISIDQLLNDVLQSECFCGELVTNTCKTNFSKLEKFLNIYSKNYQLICNNYDKNTLSCHNDNTDICGNDKLRYSDDLKKVVVSANKTEYNIYDNVSDDEENTQTISTSDIYKRDDIVENIDLNTYNDYDYGNESECEIYQPSDDDQDDFN